MKSTNLITKTFLCIVIMLSLGGIFKIYGQCTFNCIDTVNVSVNNLCTATITPAMVLKSPGASCNYGIELIGEDGSIINLDNTRADIGPQFVGMTLTVRVFEAGVSNSNSCWSVVNIEDNLPPNILCVGNDTIPCVGNDVFADEIAAASFLEEEIERTLIDNCGNEEVTVNITNNILTRALCSEDFAAVRIIGYNVLDNNANVTTCVDTIYYERFNLDSIDAPKNFVDDMSIDCNDPFPSIEYLISIHTEVPGGNSVPNIGGVSIADISDSIFVERGLCNFNLTTSDLRFETCGNTFKIVRAWTVIDWCEPQLSRIFNQVIKVTDEVINQNQLPNLGPFSATSSDCTARVTLPFPEVAGNECNDWTYVISIRQPNSTLFIPLGGVRSSTPQQVEESFAIGVSTVRYVVTDICGNSDEIEFNVLIEDTDPPIAICDHRTVVTLNESFLGKVFARSFDDGSYDICSDVVNFEVRRMDRMQTACETPGDFSDFVKFCCFDIGDTIMVELRVTDSFGMSSICWAEVIVQVRGDGPSIICAPAIGVQSCTDFESFNINSLQAPMITSSNPCLADALAPQIREVGRIIDECGDGYIDIEWYINFTGEEEVICTERIVFTNLFVFDESNILWPLDRVVESCNDLEPMPEELDNIIIGDIGCSNIVVSDPVDREFEVEGTCRKILRTWTVVDWCRFPANPDARFVFEQKIEIINSDEPVIDVDGNNVTINIDEDGCQGNVVIVGTATDDCTPSSQLEWSYRLDLIVGGVEESVIIESLDQVLNVTLATGDYVVTWMASDDCGNTAMARQFFTVSDDIAPEAVCGSIERDIVNGNNISIEASELDAGSLDNCTGEITFGVRRARSMDTPMASIDFRCSDIGMNDVELWVTDEMGNQSVCIASVDVRDSQMLCLTGSGSISLGGQIATPEDIPLESARVSLHLEESVVETEITELDGAYAFEDLGTDHRYKLHASKNDDYINGISTLDLVLMQRHILGLQPLDSPYKMIAADVNDNDAISAVDMVILRRLILGQIDAFPDSDSWLFVDRDYVFDDPALPFPFAEGVDVGSLDHSDSRDMIAVKVGDLNSNAIANSGLATSRSQDNFSLLYEVTLDNEHILYKVVASEDISSLGYQIGLAYNDFSLKTEEVRGNQVEIVEDMISDEDGRLLISVARSEPYTYAKGETILEVTFTVSDLTLYEEASVSLLSDHRFKSEIYDSGFQPLSIQLVEYSTKDEFILLQNRPNPFGENTLIEFEIPKASQIAFEVFDVNGKRVYGFVDDYAVGQHQIVIDRQELRLNKGIYYYQIHTQERSLIRKMIVL